VCLFVFIYCFVICAFAQRADGIGTFGSAKVESETLSVYSKMSKMSPVVKKLNQGDIVTIEFEIENSEGAWCSIREEGQITVSGYVQCEYLERKGKQPYASTDTVELIRAAGRGDMITVRGLLDKGIDANEKDKEFGWTALMAGALSGRTDILKILLAKGAHVDARDKFGWRAITLAERRGYEDIVQMLKEAEERE
jgi:hypothetical protein